MSYPNKTVLSYATFQPAIPGTWQKCFYTTLYRALQFNGPQVSEDIFVRRSPEKEGAWDRTLSLSVSVRGPTDHDRLSVSKGQGQPRQAFLPSSILSLYFAYVGEMEGRSEGGLPAKKDLPDLAQIV